MWQNIITSIIVAIAVFFIGRKLYLLFRAATTPSQNVICGCSCGCSDCRPVDCNKKK